MCDNHSIKISTEEHIYQDYKSKLNHIKGEWPKFPNDWIKK